jgi:uncharacterized protein (DUF2141 family)
MLDPKIFNKINSGFFANFAFFSTTSAVKFFLFSLLFSSCAQVVAPGGGTRDDYAPKVVKYSPDSAQLNFNSKTIELVFDEYIQLKDLNSQLIISPPLDKTPEIKVKNKTMTIDLEGQELKPNTTYAISFGNALQDINENNPKEDFSYIFSTGSFIDSLRVNGKVKNAFDHKTEKGILVMLYSDMSDSVVYKKLPEYFAKTNADGSFQINNIRKDKYRIIALKDANANYKYDGDPEHIGFPDSIVDPSEKKNILINTFQEPAKKIFIKKYNHPSYGKIVLVFNRGSDSLRVNNLSNDKKGVQEFIDFSRNKDTLTYWVKNYDKDSLKLQVSNGNTVIDTMEFKMIRLEDALKSKRNPLKLSLISSPNGSQSFDLGSELKLAFSHPIASIDKETAQLKEDTLARSISFTINPIDNNRSVLLAAWDSTVIIEDPNNPAEFIKAPLKSKYTGWKESTKYHLLILPGTFTDIFGFSNDSIKIDFKTKELKYYGSLKLYINLPKTQGSYIVQLLNDRDMIVNERTISNPEITESLNYDYLHPNKYRLKLIYDLNGNGKWDSGNYLQGVQPEKVVYNSELITIRSNWDAEVEWKVVNGEKNE